eukprot:gene2385-8693_t
MGHPPHRQVPDVEFATFALVCILMLITAPLGAIVEHGTFELSLLAYLAIPLRIHLTPSAMGYPSHCQVPDVEVAPFALVAMLCLIKALLSAGMEHCHGPFCSPPSADVEFATFALCLSGAWKLLGALPSLSCSLWTFIAHSISNLLTAECPMFRLPPSPW